MTVEGGSVENSTETLVAGSVLTVTCSKYYTGGGNITCDENGTWSEPELPSCTPSEAHIINKVLNPYYYFFVLTTIKLPL